MIHAQSPVIAMVVTNVNSNSIISSEVINWGSFVGGGKHYPFLYTLFLYHGVLMHSFLISVLQYFAYMLWDAHLAPDLATETPSVWSLSVLRCPIRF